MTLVKMSNTKVNLILGKTLTNWWVPFHICTFRQAELLSERQNFTSAWLKECENSTDQKPQLARNGTQRLLLF